MNRNIVRRDSGKPAKVVDQHLIKLARGANEHHAAAEEAVASTKAAAGQALQHALAAGRLLAEAKEKVEHGHFGDWLEENFTGSERHAQRYMKLAKSLPALSPNPTRVSDLTLRGALKLLAQAEDADAQRDRGKGAAESGTAVGHEKAGEGIEPAAPIHGDATPDNAQDPKGSDSQQPGESAPQSPQAPRTPPAPTDQVGRALPDSAFIRDAFAERPKYTSLMHRFSLLKGEFEQLAEGPSGKWPARHEKEWRAAVDHLHQIIRYCTPHALCPYCGGRKCETCKHTGYLPEDVYKRVPADMKREVVHQSPTSGAMAGAAAAAV